MTTAAAGAAPTIRAAVPAAVGAAKFAKAARDATVVARQEPTDHDMLLNRGTAEIRDTLAKRCATLRKRLEQLHPRLEDFLGKAEGRASLDAQRLAFLFMPATEALAHGQSFLDRWNHPGWLDAINRDIRGREETDNPMVVKIIATLDQHLEELAERSLAAADVDSVPVNPGGCRARALVVTKSNEVVTDLGNPHYCDLTVVGSDLRPVLDGFDAVVIAGPEPWNEERMRSLLGQRNNEESPLLWIFLGQYCDPKETGPHDLVLFGSLTQTPSVARVLTRLGAAASHDRSGRGSILHRIKEQVGDLSVLADRVPAAPPASACCQTFVWANLFCSKPTTHIERVARFFQEKGCCVTATVVVQHGPTEHTRPLVLDTVTANQFLEHNLSGKMSDELMRLARFRGWGCIRLDVPFQAYLELRDHLEGEPAAVWSLPFEKSGEVVWESSPSWGLELSGELAVHITLPCGDADPDVKSFAAWLVDVALGVESEPPLGAMSELQPPKEREASQTTCPDSFVTSLNSAGPTSFSSGKSLEAAALPTREASQTTCPDSSSFATSLHSAGFQTL